MKRFFVEFDIAGHRQTDNMDQWMDIQDKGKPLERIFYMNRQVTDNLDIYIAEISLLKCVSIYTDISDEKKAV